MIGGILEAVLNLVRAILESILGPTPPAPPVANDDAYTATTSVPLFIPAPGILANDTDPNGLPLTAQLVTNPSNGVVLYNPDGSFLYVSNLGFTGTDTFTYQASNGVALSNIATVTIEVVAP